MAADWQDAHTVAVDQLTAAEEQLTVSEKLPIPPLRLLTGGTVAETRKSGARAGRGGDVELRLPDVSTVSRVHAELTYADGQWWITNQGRNGLTVNGTPVSGQAPVSDGDVIQWGNRHDALTSRVQVG
jgi:pSer/pThr/pTyr-binding forkhead associated (FHA) protein